MLVLASRSPRRAELLRAAGFEFLVRAEEIDESILDGEEPQDYVQRLAYMKASAVLSSPDEIVLGADTTVVLGSEILGKPLDHQDAARMLRVLSGRKHEVLTGICLRRGEQSVRDCVGTSVWLAPVTESEIHQYISSGEPMDKAGAYGIQGFASKFIERIDGSYTNVVGLPVSLVYRLLVDRFRHGGAEPGVES